MPNSGKTTVFNALTGQSQRVGNWHGVTVNLATAKAEKLKDYIVTDLPGVRSLNGMTMEEQIAVNEVLKADGTILFIVEAITLPLIVDMLKELIKKNKRVILAINMLKELYRRGGNIDFEKLQKTLPCPIVYGEFNTNSGIKKLLNAIKEYSSKGATNFKDISINGIFTSPDEKESFLDKITLNKYTKIPILLIITTIILYLSFGNYGVGKPLGEQLSKLILVEFKNFIEVKLSEIEITPFLSGLLIDGVVVGIGSVCSFLPQSLMLIMLLNALEQSGYMSRIAYILEGFLNKTSLNGRAVFTILSGLGCTSISAITSNGLENPTVKRQAIMTSSMVSCSAKIPVFCYLATLSSVKYPFLFIASLYLLGLFLATFQLFLSQKVLNIKDRVPLILELPPYRLINLKEFFKSTLKSLRQFLSKIVSIIFIVCTAVYILSVISIDFKYVKNNYDESIIAFIGKLFKWFFYPINAGDTRISTALISGIFAKESIVGTLTSGFPNGLNLSFSTTYALAVFIYSYTPCLTALSAIAVETSKGFAVKLAILQFFEGLLFSYLTYFCIEYSIVRYVFIAIIILILITKACKGVKKRI